jgi:hypothetical protein
VSSLEPPLHIQDGIHLAAGVEATNIPHWREARAADHGEVGEYRTHDVQLWIQFVRRESVPSVPSVLCGGSVEKEIHADGEAANLSLTLHSTRDRR